MKTILTAIDFSPISRRVIADAVALAQRTNGRLVVLHVIQLPVNPIESNVLLVKGAQLAANVESSVARRLARLQARLKRLHPAVEVALRIGTPAPHIRALAKKLHADYIVIGSHGHTAIYDLIVGSTARNVLRKASCPVLVVSPVSRRRAKHRTSK